MSEDSLSARDLAAYLERIGLDRPVAADADGLAALQEAHLCAIPFENFDIPLGRGIRIEPDHLVNKLIHNRRGGFCFEQNTLFAAALRALGFPVRQQLARVAWRAEGAVRPRTHHVLLVEAGQATWLADTGFGGPGLRRPIPFETGHIADQGDGCYRLRSEAPLGTVLERERDGGWEPLYSFDLEVCWPADFQMGCHFAATHPESLFTNHLLATRLTESGRVWLMDDRLTIEEGGAVMEKRELDSTPAFRDALEAHFGLAVTEEEAERLSEFTPALAPHKNWPGEGT